MDNLRGTNKADVLWGNSTPDYIFAFRGADEIMGGAGSDVIFGGRGDDFIAGMEGSDTLFGGHGRDQFVFVRGEGSVDLIIDFNPNKDTLVFAGTKLDHIEYHNGIVRVDDTVVAVLDGNPNNPDIDLF